MNSMTEEEIVAEAKKVLDRVGSKYGHKFNYTEILMGGCSIDATGVPLTDEAIETALNSDAVLMGSIGGNTATSPWYKLAPELRPEAGLLKLRKAFIYAVFNGFCSFIYCFIYFIFNNRTFKIKWF